MTTDPILRVADRRSWWTTGQLAVLLGVPPVVLRTWDNRHGLGPARRSGGGQRLYGPRDLQRLRRMTALVNQGMRAGEAARLVLADEVTVAEARRRADEIDDAAAKVDLASLANLLDRLLAAHGPISAWDDVLAPVLRRQGERRRDGDVAYEAEWALVGAIAAALERNTPRPVDSLEGAPVVLACCRAERHSLPLQVLNAVLREARVPVVFLGEMVPAEVVIRTAVRREPVLVLLWSMTPYTADTPLLSELRRLKVPARATGPGWYPLSGNVGPVIDTLAAALRTVFVHTRRVNS
ncbi:MerR family transcriptional regulator [Amycolatopsis sp. QT-25]|uniref:MerR family transcriptional regulator n=1 Tax=Amycolatopsis sp. QT-25 TaxID=3034022 RepID=UPI0023EBE35E|nr:MerR family transcriptional regulator [Amycolatopsis sp. QT-25]WET76823.1 MerR family transcriptional regulator [Amycolatopsis sp. QT-25]